MEFDEDKSPAPERCNVLQEYRLRNDWLAREQLCYKGIGDLGRWTSSRRWVRSMPWQEWPTASWAALTWLLSVDQVKYLSPSTHQSSFVALTREKERKCSKFSRGPQDGQKDGKLSYKQSWKKLGLFHLKEVALGRPTKQPPISRPSRRCSKDLLQVVHGGKTRDNAYKLKQKRI